MKYLILIEFLVYLCLNESPILTSASSKSLEDSLFPKAVRNETDTINGYAEPLLFFKNYGSKPLIMKNVGLGKFPVSNLPDAAIAGLPPSFVIFVKPPETNQKISLRRFFLDYSFKSWSINEKIPIFLKSQLPLPDSLNCEAVTEGNLLTSNLLLRRGDFSDDFKQIGQSKSSLNCLLDGKASIILVDGLQVKEDDINNKLESFETVNHFQVAHLAPGDCIHIPSNWFFKLSSGGRTVLVSIIWNSSNLKAIDQKACGTSQEQMTLDGLNFKDEETENFLTVLSLANLAVFIESYIQQRNMTEMNFVEKLKNDVKLKDVKEWNLECEICAKELFASMDINQDKVLSDNDFDSVYEKDAIHLAGVIGDKMADFKDIIEDQAVEVDKPKPKISAKQIKSSYEKELQQVLEEGFNDLLKETNIDASLTFSEDGTPQVKLNDKRSGDKNERKTSSESRDKAEL